MRAARAPGACVPAPPAADTCRLCCGLRPVRAPPAARSDLRAAPCAVSRAPVPFAASSPLRPVCTARRSLGRVAHFYSVEWISFLALSPAGLDRARVKVKLCVPHKREVEFIPRALPRQLSSNEPSADLAPLTVTRGPIPLNGTAGAPVRIQD